MELVLRQDQFRSKKMFEGELGNINNGKTDDVLFAGWNDLAYGSEVYADLGTLTNLEKVTYFDGAGSQVLKIQTSKTFSRAEARKTVWDKATIKFNEWQDVPVNDTVRYVFFVMSSPKQQFPSEIKFFGTQTTAPAPYIPFTKPQTIGKASMGVDSGIWPPVESHFMGYTRLWFEWQWVTSATKGEYRFSNGDAAFSGKATIDKYTAAGIKTVLCLQNSPKSLPNGPNKTHLIKGLPAPYGANLENPASYKDYADACAALVKELGTSTQYELMNEWDRTWKVAGEGETEYDSYMNAVEYAAFFYACYKAMKAVNPSVVIHMGGMLYHNWRAVGVMADWFRDNTEEGKFLPASVNFHLYCTNAVDQTQESTKGISPEDYKVFEKIQEFVSYCNHFAPGVPVICTEFGWDTNTSSFSTNSYGNAEEVQASFLIRCYLALHMAGVSVAFMYNFEDWAADNWNAGKFNNSGLLYAEGLGYKPKKSHAIVKQFVDALGVFWWGISKSTNGYSLKNGSAVIEIMHDPKTQLIKLPIGTTTYTPPVVTPPVVTPPVVEPPVIVPPVVNPPVVTVPPAPEQQWGLVLESTDEFDHVNFGKELAALMAKYKLNTITAYWKRYF